MLKFFFKAHIKETLKKNFMAPFYAWGSTESRLQSYYLETIYFLHDFQMLDKFLPAYAIRKKFQ